MKRHLDEDLQKLKTNLIKMAALVEEAIDGSIESLKQKNGGLAEKIIKNDVVIDELELTNEELCIELLATKQPIAIDLRFITTGMRLNTELERIADLTVNISQRALKLVETDLIKPLIDIPKLAEVAKEMVKKTIDSFVHNNEQLAKEVILKDKEANQLRNFVYDEIINDFIVKDGSVAPRAVPLILVARDLERICDHAASIAEDVIYMVNAKVVRHHPEKL